MGTKLWDASKLVVNVRSG